jgi:hypothetical protein
MLVLLVVSVAAFELVFVVDPATTAGLTVLELGAMGAANVVELGAAGAVYTEVVAAAGGEDEDEYTATELDGPPAPSDAPAPDCTPLAGDPEQAPPFGQQPPPCTQ